MPDGHRRRMKSVKGESGKPRQVRWKKKIDTVDTSAQQGQTWQACTQHWLQSPLLKVKKMSSISEQELKGVWCRADERKDYSGRTQEKEVGARETECCIHYSVGKSTCYSCRGLQFSS